MLTNPLLSVSKKSPTNVNLVDSQLYKQTSFTHFFLFLDWYEDEHSSIAYVYKYISRKDLKI